MFGQIFDEIEKRVVESYRTHPNTSAPIDPPGTDATEKDRMTQLAAHCVRAILDMEQ